MLAPMENKQHGRYEKCSCPSHMNANAFGGAKAESCTCSMSKGTFLQA